MQEPEMQCILDLSEIPRENYTVIDALTQAPQPEDLDGYDLLVMGGSSVSELEHKAAVLELIREARRRDLPTLGICFGGQLMTEALGGTLECRPDDQEFGGVEVFATEAAKYDPVFSRLPERYLTIQGHKYYMAELPEGAVILARSAKAPVQAWSFPGEPFYALQMHSELNDVRFRERLEFYKHLYIGNQAELDRIYATLKPTPEAAQIMNYFLQYAFGPRSEAKPQA